MDTLVIILLSAGVLCLIASFMIPEEKQKDNKEENDVTQRQAATELTKAEQDKVRERINDIINEQLGDISEKTEAQLDKISNTKILELNEYADTVMNEINKNHNETVFLYDMLNEKAKEVKNTVKDVNNVKKEVDKAVSESAAALENKPQMPDKTVLVSQNDELKKQAETKNRNDSNKDNSKDVDIENANSKNKKILNLYKEGLDNRTIAKQLGLGIGEVKLVVDLYKNSQG